MMKKINLILALICITSASAQTPSEKGIEFVKSFKVGLGLSNLMPNKSMMGDAHETARPVFYGDLGIFHIKQFTLGLHGNASIMNVKDTQYYGDFNQTIYYTLGPFLSYYQQVSPDIFLEPYISYDITKYQSKYDGKKITYGSNALGIGLDFQYKVSNSAFFTFGLKYNISKLKTNTNPNWEKYLNNHHFFSAKIGFSFAKNRL